MKVIRMRIGQAPEVIELEPTRQAMEREMGGEIASELVTMDMEIVFRAKQSLGELGLNCIFMGEIYAGPVILVGRRLGKLDDAPNVEFWMEELRRGREKAAPLIRELERGT